MIQSLRVINKQNSPSQRVRGRLQRRRRMARIIKTVGLASGDVLSLSVMNGDTYLDSNVSIAELNELINSPILRPRYRIFLLHPDETIDYQIPDEDILLSGSSYSEQYQNGQRRSLSFTLHNSDKKYTPSINTLWAESEFALDLGIEKDDGSIVWKRSGIYVASSLTPSESVDSQTVSVQTGDKFSIFEGKAGTLETSYEIPVGTDIEGAIRGILLSAKGNGYPFDSKPIIYHSGFKGKKTQAKISKSAGETLGSILLELANQLSAEMFYNANGNLTILPTQETTLDIDKPVICYLNDENGDFSGLSFGLQMSNIVNRVVVIGATVNGKVYTATAVNDDSASPLCYQRIGYRTGQIVNDSNITSQDLADDRSKYELRKQLILKSSVSVNISFNPLLSVNNLIEITDEFFGLDHERFLLQGVSCGLDYSGSMSITVSNVRNLPFASRI